MVWYGMYMVNVKGKGGRAEGAGRREGGGGGFMMVVFDGGGFFMFIFLGGGFGPFCFVLFCFVSSVLMGVCLVGV